ncbi:MAG: NTP transferase domain-containing protein, partial [Muribaculaceae bacterium]|nr:NTP transferase domain-containing protein [Muribaculaceae bacterium]
MHFGIIAAGEGSRLRQEGVELPKPLVRLDGTPMIERLTDIFVANGAESVSIIINEYMT